MLTIASLKDPTASVRLAPALAWRWAAVSTFAFGLGQWLHLTASLCLAAALLAGLTSVLSGTPRGAFGLAVALVVGGFVARSMPGTDWLLVAGAGAVGAWAVPLRAPPLTLVRAAAVAVIGFTWAVPLLALWLPLPAAAEPLVAMAGAGLWLAAVAWEHDHPRPPSARHVRKTVAPAHVADALHLREQTIAVVAAAPAARTRRQAVEVCERALDLHRRRDALQRERDRLSGQASPPRPAHMAVILQALQDLDARLASVTDGLEDARTTCTAAQLGVGMVDHDDLAHVLGQLHHTARELQARQRADLELATTS